MGVNGLWHVFYDGAKKGQDLKSVCLEAFRENGNGLRGWRVGIDSSIWMVLCSRGVVGRHAQLEILFHHLLSLLSLPILPLFVFDGTKRPSIKRGRCIVPSAFHIEHDFKNLIRVFGFEVWTADGEAEAEIVNFIQKGWLDGAWTDDGDAILLGASYVIRNLERDVFVTLHNRHKHFAQISSPRDPSELLPEYTVLENTSVTNSSNRSDRMEMHDWVFLVMLQGGDYWDGVFDYRAPDGSTSENPISIHDDDSEFEEGDIQDSPSSKQPSRRPRLDGKAYRKHQETVRSRARKIVEIGKRPFQVPDGTLPKGTTMASFLAFYHEGIYEGTDPIRPGDATPSAWLAQLSSLLRQHSLPSKVPPAHLFPSMAILELYFAPTVSTEAKIRDEMPEWKMEVDIPGLVKFGLQKIRWSERDVQAKVKDLLFPAMVMGEMRKVALVKDALSWVDDEVRVKGNHLGLEILGECPKSVLACSTKSASRGKGFEVRVDIGRWMAQLSDALGTGYQTSGQTNDGETSTINIILPREILRATYSKELASHDANKTSGAGSPSKKRLRGGGGKGSSSKKRRKVDRDHASPSKKKAPEVPKQEGALPLRHGIAGPLRARRPLSARGLKRPVAKSVGRELKLEEVIVIESSDAEAGTSKARRVVSPKARKVVTLEAREIIAISSDTD